MHAWREKGRKREEGRKRGIKRKEKEK